MFLMAGCQPSDAPVGLKSFSDPDPLIRISAMKWAAENQVDQAIGPLVDALADEDAAVRFFAIQALVRITGKDYGYDYKANARRRLQAMARWRQFLKDTASTAPVSQLEP